MSDYRRSTCRGSTCTASIIWATTQATGKSIPVDADPHPDGNVELIPNLDAPERAPWAVVHSAPPLLTTGTLHMPHHATCPDVTEFRR